MASFSVAFPLSNGIGALINGLIVELAGYAWMYVAAALLCSMGLIVTRCYWAKLQ
jgi:predicted MFS family arabinose efflux permease